jgi:hypothetical protein
MTDLPAPGLNKLTKCAQCDQYVVTPQPMPFQGIWVLIAPDLINLIKPYLANQHLEQFVIQTITARLEANASN